MLLTWLHNSGLSGADKPFGIERPVGGQRQADDLIVVFMVVCFDEKIRYNLKDAVDAKGVTAKHLGEINAATLGAVITVTGVWFGAACMGLSFADVEIGAGRPTSMRERSLVI
jgi:hypothetical protein